MWSFLVALATTDVRRSCGEFKSGTFADMHDGDEKHLSLTGATLTITPAHNAQKWKIVAELNPTDCTAVVDFDVPGKPSPPPVKLLAAVGTLEGGGAGAKWAITFSDPSGTIAKPHYPLNAWIELPASARAAAAA